MSATRGSENHYRCRRCGHPYGWRGGISFEAICDLGRRIREHYAAAHPGFDPAWRPEETAHQ